MRPRKLSGDTDNVTFALPKPEAEALRQVCQRLGISQSELLRRLVRQAIKTPKAPVDALTRLERIEEEARRLREELTQPPAPSA